MAMTSIIINLGIGLTYFLLSRIALMLALTPGAEALIWPPAGLALAACLIWRGKRIWPGLVIGSVLSNSMSAEGQFETDWLPWLISFGSVAQALVGEKLLRYYEPELEFSRPMSVFRLWMVAFGSCFIAAINSSTALWLTGFFGADQFFFTMINGWLGDALGILIFTPLVMVIFDRRDVWNGRRSQIGVTLFIGVIFCGFLQHSVKISEEQELVNHFSRMTPAIIIFIIALLMCSVLGAIALIISGERRYINQEVERKTQELMTEIQHRTTVETNLRQSEERINTMFEQAPLGISLVDAFTGQIYEVNQRFADITGRTREELLNSDWMRITHPDDIKKNTQQMKLLNAGKISEYNMSKRYVRPDNSFVWINMTIAPLNENADNRSRHLCMIEDITERKVTEVRSARLKNLYRDLATINELIIHAKNKHELLDVLCRIPIESGLMSMAWIGIEVTTREVLIPLVKYGYGLDYLDNITVSTHAGKVEAQGVAGSAYRKKKAYIANDALNSPTMAPWHNHIEKYGWNSVASFPIFRHGDIYAVFTVYNTEINFFDDEVTALINTLTNDVSYALDALDATQELIRSETRNRLLLESSPSGIMGIDVDGATTFVNPIAAKMLGYSPEELTGIPMHETIHHSHADGRTYLREACPTHVTLKDGKVRSFDNEVFWRRDNSCFPVGYTSHPIYQEGIIQGAVVVFQDITERLKVQEQRNEERRYLQNIIEGTHAGTWEWNLDTGEAVYNERWAEIVGYHLSEIVPFTQKSWEQFVHPDDLKRAKTLIQKHLEGELVYYECDIRMRHKDGRWIWVAARGKVTHRTTDGEPLIMSGTHIDATLRCEAEETLRIAHAEERAIFDSATSGIVLVKDGIIQRCNRKLETIFGYSAGELSGQPTKRWYLDDTIYLNNALPMYDAFFEGNTDRIEQQLFRKNGSLFWARLSGKALDKNDSNKGFVIIIDDITGEHAATAQLIKAKDIAEEATKLKSDFLANMSHEIRTPMNGVLGMLELLSDSSLSSNQLDWVKTAYSSGEALLDIINAILDLTKLEADKVDIEHIEFNVIDLVEEVCTLLSTRTHSKELELNCFLPMTLSATWLGDPIRIRQVLTNLLGNAIKFTEQGEVSVTVLPVFVDSEHTQLRFEVTDTGIGISEDDLARLFKPFVQADSATSRRFGGSGLGLSISKKLVDLMGGTLGVNSTPDSGSCFWFTLPVVQTVNGSESDKLSFLSGDLSGNRVLIVDDNATNRTILNHYLSSWGLVVSEVKDASEALMALQTSSMQDTSYDLILLDRQMPIMDGLTLAKCLTQIPAISSIPIILLCSDNPLGLSDYQETRIVQCLMKPLRQLQLYNGVLNALKGDLSSSLTQTEIHTQTQTNSQFPKFEGKKVLVVEDNKINQKVIVSKLARFNIIPEVAENGQLALEKLARTTYDLIFMDCHMPILDGYAATQELRLREAREGIPHQTVVALTANALKGEREKCLAAGMDEYVSKPISTEQLTQLLIEQLGVPTLKTELIQTQVQVTIPISEIKIEATMTHEHQLHTSITSVNQTIWDETSALKYLEEDSELLDDMIILFLSDLPTQLRELSEYSSTGNLLALGNTAHAIKGAVGNFFATSATECARELEHTARVGQSADYKGLTEALITALTDLMNALQLHLGQKSV
ncbi:MAG: PAS domain S-box protein [Methylococcales bacterium]